MARIRIVDEWLRSPVSPPSRYRAIMVVAETWGEQRVLMRAFSSSPDQTRPTIVLHGAELAIGPAGTDPHTQWGIHVEPPADGRAQELRQQLELAARRLAGSKGNPPRLEDEVPAFERKRTNNWAPGSPRDLPTRRTHFGPAQARTAAGVPPSERSYPAYYEPANLAPPTQGWPPPSPTPVGGMPQPAYVASNPAPSSTPVAGIPEQHRKRGWTSPLPTTPAREVGSTTALGFAPGTSAPTPVAPRPSSQRFGAMVSNTCPLGFRLDDRERAVLNALGENRPLRASEIAEIAGVPDGAAWMDELMSRLANHGMDLVMPGDVIGGERSYVLRR